MLFHVNLHVAASGSIVFDAENETAARAAVELALKLADFPDMGSLDFEEIEIVSIVPAPVEVAS
jgi:hypothetical protein